MMDPDCMPVFLLSTEFAYVLDFSSDNTHAGLSLTDAYPGIRVSSVERRDQAEMVGIRRGDIISHINGIRCRSAASAINTIQYAKRLRMRIQIQGRHPHPLSMIVRRKFSRLVKRMALYARLRHVVSSSAH